MWELLPQQVVNGLALGSTYALLALGLTLVFGVLLIPNFAHGELYMLGGFVSYTLVALGINFWFAALAAALLVAAVGVLLDRVVFKPIDGAPSLSLMIAALAASIILQQAATMIWGAEPRTTPNPVPGLVRTAYFSVTYYQIVLFAGLVLVFGALWIFLHRSRMGLAIRAASQNKDAALLMGIDMDQVRLCTFAIGAGIGGLAGALLGASFPIFPTVGVTPVLKAFVVVVLGGMGSLWGAVAAGLFLGMTEIMVAAYVSSMLQDIGAFLILILVLLIRPQGLFGTRRIER